MSSEHLQLSFYFKSYFSARIAPTCPRFMDNAQPGYRFSSLEMRKSPDRKIWWLIGFIILLTLAAVFFKGKQSSPVSQPPTPSPAPTVVQQTASPSAIPSLTLGKRTKTSGCVAVKGLEDKDCTPGAIIDGATKDQICVPGYSKSVRDVPESEKNEVYLEYGILTRTTGEYEVDHLISLELGGSNDISNLWPEAAQPIPGFHEKDKVENYLHEQVCSGKVTLQQAQLEIANNWEEVYKSLP